MAEQPLTTFFSYSREDSVFVLRLAKDLRAAGAVIWLDQLDIEPGKRWDTAVEDALRTCSNQLAVLSPAAVNSVNVMDEVSYALEEHKQVIPVLYRDCQIPFRLRRVQYIDFRTDYERGLRGLLRTLGVEPTKLPKVAGQQEAGLFQNEKTDGTVPVGKVDERESRAIAEAARKKEQEQNEREAAEIARRAEEHWALESAEAVRKATQQHLEREVADEAQRVEEERRAREAAAAARPVPQERREFAAMDKARQLRNRWMVIGGLGVITLVLGIWYLIASRTSQAPGSGKTSLDANSAMNQPDALPQRNNLETQRAAVVKLRVQRRGKPDETATGVFVGKDARHAYFITVLHAVRVDPRSEDIVLLPSVRIQFYHSPQTFEALVLEYFDPSLDLAVVYIPIGNLPSGMPQLWLKDVALGVPVHVIGNSAAGDWSVASSTVENENAAGGDIHNFTITRGKSLAEGYFGGPVLDDQGNFLGMHTETSVTYGIGAKSGLIVAQLKAWHVPTDNLRRN